MLLLVHDCLVPRVRRGIGLLTGISEDVGVHQAIEQLILVDHFNDDVVSSVAQVDPIVRGAKGFAQLSELVPLRHDPVGQLAESLLGQVEVLEVVDAGDLHAVHVLVERASD